MSKPRRKYNPHRQAVKLSKTFSRKFAVVWAGTLNGEVYSINSKKKAQLTRSEALAITDVAHVWTVYICVLLRDNQGKEYLQYEQMNFNGEYRSADISDLVISRLNEFYKTCNPNHRVNIAWVATTHRNELEADALAEMLSDIGAWEFLAKWETNESSETVKVGV